MAQTTTPAAVKDADQSDHIAELLLERSYPRGPLVTVRFLRHHLVYNPDEIASFPDQSHIPTKQRDQARDPEWLIAARIAEPCEAPVPAPPPQAADLVTIRFKLPCGPFNPGEIAGFPPEKAEDLIRQGAAEPAGLGSSDPSPLAQFRREERPSTGSREERNADATQ